MPDTTKSKFTIHKWFTTRHLLVVTSCFGMINVYAIRVNLSIALVAMVNSTTHLQIDTRNISKCPHYNNNNTTTSHSSENGEFNWDAYEQGIILGSFYWGYILNQVPAGRLSELYSATWVFGLGVLISSILTLLTPIAARQGLWPLVALRVAIGFAQSGSYPSMTYLISCWSLPWERSTMITIVFSGTALGTLYGTIVSGTVLQFWEWPYAFYVTGIVGISWCILWKVIAYDKPSQHPWISEAERSCFESHIKSENSEKHSIPWKSIVTSLPLWAILLCHFCGNWVFHTFISDLPTYLKNILHYDISQNSVRSSLPHLGSWSFSIICSLLCDFLIKRQFLSLTGARRIFNSIGFLVPSLLLFIVTMIECQEETVYILLALSFTFLAASLSGYFTNLLDIASSYSGTLKGIINAISTIPGWMAPYLVGYFTSKESTAHQWNKVFYVSCGLTTFAGIFYIIFATSEEQLWNKQKNTANQNRKTEIDVPE